MPRSEQLLWTHRSCFCAANYQSLLPLFLSALGNPRHSVPICWPFKFWNMYDLQSLIQCDPIPSPVPETIYEERLWIEVVPSRCFLTFFHWCCYFCRLCLLRPIFLAVDSKKLFSSPQQARVTFLVKSGKLELTFWLFGNIHAVMQMPPDGVVGSRNCRCHPFAACHPFACGCRRGFLAFYFGVLANWTWNAHLL